MKKRSLTLQVQYLDLLTGVLDNIAEVRLPGHDRSLQLYLAGTQRNLLMTPMMRVAWRLRLMTIFSSSRLKTWYVQVRMQDPYPNLTSNTRTKYTRPTSVQGMQGRLNNDIDSVCGDRYGLFF
jgi:hypothetical protein